MNAQFGFVSAVAHTLMHSLWQIALLTLLAELSFAQMRNWSAGTRHVVGMLWLLLMLIAPLLTFALNWHAPEISSDGIPMLSINPEAGQSTATAQSWLDWVWVSVAEIWMLGVSIMLALQIGGWNMIRRIEQQPYLELPQSWQLRVDALCRTLGIGRFVLVRLADRVSSPFTVYLFRPIVWLPISLLTQFTPDQIEALLAHELAHIRRLDWCWNAVQCVIECLMFYHPGVWWLNRRIRQERELACDDIAVAACGDAIVLAEALALLQSQRNSSSRLVLAAQGGTLMDRISYLLSRAPARYNWRALTILSALLFLLCSGSLLAMQVDSPRHLLINLTVSSSSAGPLTPGNYREYKASYVLDKPRYYRVSMDANGTLHEEYREDGVTKQIDGQVRAWLGEVEIMSPPAPPAPTLPPLPAMEALPALPAMPPPPPPPPPKIADSAEFNALMKTIQSDSRLIALVGSPVAIQRDSFHGSVHTWGGMDFHLWGIDDSVGGKAQFTMDFIGPKGRANVQYEGKTKNGVWEPAKLIVQPLASVTGK